MELDKACFKSGDLKLTEIGPMYSKMYLIDRFPKEEAPLGGAICVERTVETTGRSAKTFYLRVE